MSESQTARDVVDDAVHEPAGAPRSDDHPDNVAGDDSAVFIEHARWLFEWHNKRAEAMTSRAVAVLGFNGVVLALLLQGAALGGVDPTAWTWLTLGLALAILLASALLALQAIRPRQVRIPSVTQLRNQWLDHRTTGNLGFASRNVAEAFLNSEAMEAPSAVDDAKADADRRAQRLTESLWLLIVAMALIAILLLNILMHR